MESIELLLTGSGGAAASFIATQAVSKWRLNRLEKDLEEGFHAVKIAKSSRFKELKDEYNEKLSQVKEDYREREQVLHARIDRTRDENNKRFDDMSKSIAENNDKLDKKIDAGFTAINTRLDAFIQNINK